MDPELKRFRQTVRSQIRAHVKAQREAPPLTLWASQGDNPRRVQSLHVGAAVNAAEVKARIVEGIRQRGSSYAAIGRLLHIVDDVGGGEMFPTSVFGLVVAHEGGVQGWEVDVVAGRVGAWREWEIKDVNAWFFVQQAIRGVAARGSET